MIHTSSSEGLSIEEQAIREACAESIKIDFANMVSALSTQEASGDSDEEIALRFAKGVRLTLKAVKMALEVVKENEE